MTTPTGRIGNPNGPPGEPEAGPTSTSVTLGRRGLLRVAFQRPTAVVALAYLVIALLIALSADWLAPYGFNEQILEHRHQAPGAQHWLGADDFGRDQLTRMMHGGLNSLAAAVLATSVAVAIGGPLGLLAGYFRTAPDQILSRFSEAIQAVPPILLALAVVTALGRGLVPAMIAVGIVSSPRVFRIVRASVMAAAAEPYVEAARSMGGSPWHVLRRHLVRPVATPLLVECVYLMSITLLTEAALAYLGLSVQPPGTSWGDLLARGIPSMEEAPHLVIFPGLAIFLAVLSFNAIGESLRKALDRSTTR